MDEADRQFSGVRLIARRGARPECVSSGFADRNGGVPWTPDTASQIASISKQLVAVVSLLLADRGVLRLDDPVAALLPEAPPQWQKVTLQQLMTHTSGLPHWSDRPGFDPSVAVAPERRLRHFLGVPLPDGAGATWQYSSPGYVVLGAAVERAARRRYADLARELIIDPLALAATTIGTTPKGQIARGYRRGQPVPPWDLASMPGTGDVWSSALDVGAFLTALHDGGLLPPSALTILRNTNVPLGRGADRSAPVATTGYSLGHFIGSVNGRPARLHPGDNPGYQALAAWFPANGTAIVILSNDETDDLEAVLADAESPSART